MMTNPPAYGGKGVSFFEKFERFPVFSLFRQGDVALNTDMGRAGGLTGSRASLCDGVSARNRLGIAFEYGAPRGQGLIVFVFQFYRACLEAVPAACALVEIYIAGMLDDSCLEMTLFPLEFAEFRCREKLDVQVPADLDQFGRNNSHGAVIGGECLVQLRHHPANGR